MGNRPESQRKREGEVASQRLLGLGRLRFSVTAGSRLERPGERRHLVRWASLSFLFPISQCVARYSYRAGEDDPPGMARAMARLE